MTPRPTPLAHWPRLALAALLLVLALIPAAPAARAQAVTIRYAAPAAVGGDCLSWATACPLQTALAGAGIGAQIWVQAGVYTPGAVRSSTFRLKDVVAIYGGFAGGETDLSQRNPAQNITTLSGEIGAAGSEDNVIHVVTGSGTGGTAILDGVTISGGYNFGYGDEYAGGGVYIVGGSPTLINVIIRDNWAAVGGGVYIEGGSLTLSNVTLHGNQALSGAGLLSIDSTLLLGSVTFSGNHAYLNGGGLYTQGGRLTLTNVTISGNHADDRGGGIFNDGSEVVLSNVTIHNNFADTAGGGIAHYEYGAPNTGLSNTILWGNDATSAPQYSGKPEQTTVMNSVIQGGCPAQPMGCYNVIAGDPRLGELGDYGGPLQTVPLLPGSAAIDAGVAGLDSSDARGVGRPQGAAWDIGAYEARPFTLAKTGGDHQSALVGDPFPTALALSVSSASGDPVDGGVITFTAPGSGASAVPASATRTIEHGAVQQSVTANAVAGAFTLTAAANGAPPASFALTNFKSSSTTTLTSSTGSSTLGQGVTFIATVGGAQPGGSVTFITRGANIAGCIDVPVHHNRAVCFTDTLGQGGHGVIAEYSGDWRNEPSSDYLLFAVHALAHTSIASSLNPAHSAQMVTFTVTVSAVAPGIGVPSGSVMLYTSLPPEEGVAGASAAAAQSLAAPAPLVNGVAEFHVASLPVGVHRLLAVYSSDVNFDAGEPAQFVQVVNPWMLFYPVALLP